MLYTNPTLFILLYASILFAGAFGLMFWSTWRKEHQRKPSSFDEVWGLDQKDTFTSVAFGEYVLPVNILLFLVYDMLNNRWKNIPADLFRSIAGFLFGMSLYYLLLLALAPFLRRHFSARACAAAWVLPALVYYATLFTSYVAAPRIILYCPAWLISWFAPVWFAGFVLLLARSFASHLSFRRRILREASDECDAAVLAVWQQELEAIGRKTPIRLVRCASAPTPFSMGSWRRVLTVLPQRAYTEEELRLIFRHELHHIRRDDASSKFFFAFVRALFWFHPLVWLAARQSSRDMERSCDEIVLEGADSDTRKRYAVLLLHTAEEPPGFTTCLSADAASLRSRLKSVMQTQGSRRGTVFLMAVLFVCILFQGTLALSDERATLGEMVGLDGVTRISYELRDKNPGGHSVEAKLEGNEAKALLAYLAALPAEHLAEPREEASMPAHPCRLYLTGAGDQQPDICIHDGGATVYDWRKPGDRTKVYYMREALDWDEIEAFFPQQQQESEGFL